MKLFVLITIYCCLRSNNGEDNNNILGAEFIDAEEFEYTKDIPLEKKLWVGRTFGVDRLLYANRTTKTGRWFRRERTVFSFNASRVGIITAVSFKVINDYPKCFLNYISGGIGRKNLTVEVKSAFNKGFCVQMDIFGYPVFQRKHRKRPKNTTIQFPGYFIYKYKKHKNFYSDWKIIPR